MAVEEGITVKKSENFSEWYTQVIQKAELADIRYNVKGFLVHMPWAVRTMKNMYNFFENELEKRGHEPVWFPSIIPESFLKKEREHAEFSAEVFWVTEGGSDYKKLEEKLALRPTSETAMYSIFSLWIRSWRDLPFKTYQSCQVWRYESYTRPFIRGREFYWIEAHDVFATEKEALQQVKEDMEITEEIMHKKFGIPFLFFERPQHDKFKGAVSTFAADTIMPDGRVIQLPSTHFLGQNFSRAFNIKFTDKDNKEKYVWQTCYGPCIWRIFGAMVALHGDDKGLILPPAVSPIQIIIIPIFYTKTQEKRVVNECKKIKEELEKNGIRADVDLRKEFTPGWKYNYWELKGVPLRIEVGPDDVKKRQVIFVRRDEKNKIKVERKNIVNKAKKTLDDIQKKLVEKADEFFKSNIYQAKTFDEVKKILNERGGLIKVNWCGRKECADYIKSETEGGKIRGTLFGKKEKVFGKCIWCGQKANQVVYIAKEY